MGRWKRKFVVTDKLSRKKYIVSLTRNDEWQCDCKYWIFRRKTCKHILQVWFKFNINLGKIDELDDISYVESLSSLFNVEEIDPELTGTIIRLADSMGRG